MNNRVLLALKNIEKEGLDALLLSNPVNISYLTGFRPAEGYLLINSKRLVYFTNFIYAQEARKLRMWKVNISRSNIFANIVKETIALHIKNIGFEEKNISYLEYKKIKEMFLKEHIKFLPSYGIIEKMRSVKKKDEIALIKKAVDITSSGIEFIKEIMNPNMTEKYLQTETERFLKLKGDDTLAFPPVVAFGKNTSIVHHIPSQKKLSNNKIILIDLGARYYGYCADLTRTVFLDKMPLSIKRIYGIVQRSAELAIKKIREGVKINEVDKAARDFIDKKGFGKYFGHGLGHGVGMSVHEEPYLNPFNSNILKKGMVVTIEPAIYLPSKFGIRIENMILVKTNRAEVLSGDIYR
ncbi:MAG: hypothetical protein B1H08_03920 [Candidatus Omnitrophica bacterium 4484_171]|nr:MAG: hypothetical protein B1H08_03920 [Candidatus Omnitrophica bacterium 4484_171]